MSLLSFYTPQKMPEEQRFSVFKWHEMASGRTIVNKLLRMNGKFISTSSNKRDYCIHIVKNFTLARFIFQFVLIFIDSNPFHANIHFLYCRSNHRRCFIKKGVLKNFTRPATLLKNRLWHRCFPVNFKFSCEISGWLPLLLFENVRKPLVFWHFQAYRDGAMVWNYLICLKICVSCYL